MTSRFANACGKPKKPVGASEKRVANLPTLLNLAAVGATLEAWMVLRNG